MGDREAAKIANRISLLMIICLVILVFLVQCKMRSVLLEDDQYD